MFSDSMMLGGGRKAAFSIANSVRLDGVADYFTRTPAVVGNSQVWTYSGWLKVGVESGGLFLLTAGDFSGGQTGAVDKIWINDSPTEKWLEVASFPGGASGYDWRVRTSALFRDPTAWYHVVVALDTHSAAAEERVKIWINGQLQTNLALADYPDQHKATLINSTQFPHYINKYCQLDVALYTAAGYFADTILVDGAALDPSHFGETDPVTGSWRPKRYVGQVATYGGDITQPGMSVTGTFNHALNCGPITALIDNTTQPAADNAGHTASSHFVIDLGGGNALPVRRALLTNHTSTGINVAGITWGCWFSDDNATFTLAASMLMETGLGTVNRFDIPDVGAHRYWKFGYLSGAVSGDCWLQEVSLHAATALGYGTNGFHLDFADNADLGNDVSGKGNVWLPVSLGAADVVSDSPTNNFATWNPLTVPVNGTDVPALINQGSLTAQTSSSGSVACRSMATQSLSTTVKQWIEIRIDAFPFGSLAGKALSVALGEEMAYPWSESSTSVGRRAWELYVQASGATAVATGMNTTLGQIPGYSPAVGDTIVFAYDPGQRHLWLGILPASGTLNWVGGGSPETGVSPTWILPADVGPLFPMCAIGGGSTSGAITANFGQIPFVHTPPAGFKSLCTANLPKPVIQAPAKHMDVVTYSGTGTARSISGLDFQPDLVWVKSRSSGSAGHTLFDVIRGPGKILSSSASSAELTEYPDTLISFNPDGFGLGVDVTAGTINVTGQTYVAWCWKAGGAAVANTAGSIASTVSANPTAGFSIATYTGTGSAATVGHGLGTTPALVIAKDRSNAVSWRVYHSSVGATKELYLDLTNAATTSATAWNDTSPTSSVFSLGAGAGAANESGHTYVAYCWAEVPGFSKFGSYTGNGSSDGAFVHCGFRPRLVLAKRTDATGSWRIVDTARDPYNEVVKSLYPNSIGAEDPSDGFADFTATGFKIRRAVYTGTYIYAAFAEAPLGGAKTVPAKAR
ncbi:MAG: hypothetical protein FD176_75 [Rhodospirillaceae bacterium]|nr:MAG: hypothetical protein FD176_75 [Rhodospirillaceae bacterium]TNC94859.1 MAG: hypothetical protein FD119_2908 [Stygiobacter sp.]